MNILKSKYISGAMISCAMMMTSCSDFTDIDPKGVNLLSTTSELELLLNPEYYTTVSDMQEITGDLISGFEPITTLLMPPVKTSASIIMGWDEEGHENELPQLTTSDDFYNTCYSYIGTIANPILAKVDDASGNQATKDALKGEAYVIRAYFHFLAVNKFAPAYDKSTAANTVALAYVKEDQDIKQPTTPIMLDEFYNNIIADLDAAIVIDAFEDFGINQMRFGKVCAYAVKAQALMCMQQPEKAAECAKMALELKSIVSNYFDSMNASVNMWGETYMTIYRPRLAWQEDYFADYNMEYFNVRPLFDQLEDGHAVKDNFSTTNLAYGGVMDFAEMYLGLPGLTMTFDLDSTWPVIGLSSPHMYLLLAENAINNSDFNEAMRNLDIIRKCRIAPDVYEPLEGTVNDKAAAIEKLKQTANGEQFYNVWCFITKKRWTRLDDYKETVSRDLGGIQMTLTPESKMWVFPIPQNVISNNPNFQPYMN